MAPLKIIIFDVYNTLLYISEKCSPYKDIIKASSKPAATKEYILTHYIQDASKLCKNLEKIGLVNSSIDIDVFTAKIQTELQSIKMYDEVPKTLITLKQQGYRLGVISNVAAPYISAFYQHSLDSIIDYSIFSCEFGFAKPSLEIYEQIWKLAIRDFQQLNYNEMLMIGDNFQCDAKIPREIGMQAILVQRNGDYANGVYLRSLDRLFLYL